MSMTALFEDEERRRIVDPNYDNPNYTDQGEAPRYSDQNPPPQVTPQATAAVPAASGSGAPSQVDDYLRRLNERAAAVGSTPETGWRDDFMRVPGREADVFQHHWDNQVRRAGSTDYRTVDSQSAAGQALYGSGTTPQSVTQAQTAPSYQSATTPASVPAVANTSPLFDDPASRLIEDYALEQFQRRQNPDPASGTALFEQYARELIETLKQAPYTQGDEALIKTQATNAIMVDRDQTRQRWVEEMGRRGIPLSSGPALEGLMQIDQHFQGLKTTVDANFAREAIQRTRDQRVQVLDTAGQLANSEEGRLREALTYATLPKTLQDNAFQQGLQLVGAGGNPQSMLNSALNLFNTVQSNNRLEAQDRADSIEALMEVIAGLGYGLTR